MLTSPTRAVARKMLVSLPFHGGLAGYRTDRLVSLPPLHPGFSAPAASPQTFFAQTAPRMPVLTAHGVWAYALVQGMKPVEGGSLLAGVL